MLLVHFLITSFAPSLSHRPDLRATEYQTDVGKSKRGRPSHIPQLSNHPQLWKSTLAVYQTVSHVLPILAILTQLSLLHHHTVSVMSELPHIERYRGKRMCV